MSKKYVYAYNLQKKALWLFSFTEIWIQIYFLFKDGITIVGKGNRNDYSIYQIVVQDLLNDAGLRNVNSAVGFIFFKISQDPLESI